MNCLSIYIFQAILTYLCSKNNLHSFCQMIEYNHRVIKHHLDIWKQQIIFWNIRQPFIVPYRVIPNIPYNTTEKFRQSIHGYGSKCIHLFVQYFQRVFSMEYFCFGSSPFYFNTMTKRGKLDKRVNTKNWIPGNLFSTRCTFKQEGVFYIRNFLKRRNRCKRIRK